MRRHRGTQDVRSGRLPPESVDVSAPGLTSRHQESADQPVALYRRRRCACSRQGTVRHREPKPSGCADRDRRVGAAGCGLGDRGTRAHSGHYPRAPTGITPDDGLSHGVRAAERPASRHHRVGCLHPQRHRRPGTPVPAAGADGLIPVAHAGRQHRGRIQSSVSGRSSPTSILSARSPIRRMPATCISRFHRPRTPAGDRLVHRAAGGYRPVHVHQHPTGPLQVQAKQPVLPIPCVS